LREVEAYLTITIIHSVGSKQAERNALRQRFNNQ